MNRVTRRGSRGRSGLWRAHSLAAAVSGALLLLACAERQPLARFVVEILLRFASMAG